MISREPLRAEGTHLVPQCAPLGEAAAQPPRGQGQASIPLSLGIMTQDQAGAADLGPHVLCHGGPETQPVLLPSDQVLRDRKHLTSSAFPGSGALRALLLP